LICGLLNKRAASCSAHLASQDRLLNDRYEMLWQEVTVA